MVILENTLPTVPEEETRRHTTVAATSPAQILVNEELTNTKKKIADFHVVQNTVGLSNDHKKELKALIDLKMSLEKKLNRLKINQRAAMRKRAKKRKAIDDIVQSHPQRDRFVCIQIS